MQILLPISVVGVLFIQFTLTQATPVRKDNDGAIFFEQVAPIAPPEAYRRYRSAYGGPNYQPHTVMYHRYYTRPAIRPRHTGTVRIPEGAMTAFVAGDTVAAGSAYHNHGQPSSGANCRQCTPEYESLAPQSNISPIAITPSNNRPQPSAEILPPIESNEEPYPNGSVDDQRNQIVPGLEPESTTTVEIASAEEPELVTKSPTNKARKPAVTPRRPAGTEDDEDDDYNPFNGRGNFPVYNSFFPIVFGGGGRSYGPGLENTRKRGSGEGGSSLPGGATAIANSFSTGKGGVATSHATAYGGPSP